MSGAEKTSECGRVRRRPAAPGGGRGPVGRPPRRPRYPCLRGAGPHLESLPDLLELLPPEFSYHVCSYEPLPVGFAATLRVNFDTERGACDWLASFQQSSLTTFRSRRTFPQPGPRQLYKAWFRCQRNVPGSAADSPAGRHTGCPAALAVSVCSPSVSRRVDPHLPASPGCVRLKHVHNHPVRCASDLRFRGVSAEARGALETLLARGYPPAAARRALVHQLQLQLGERYPLAAADRAVLPTPNDVCRIYYQQYGTPAQRRATAAATTHQSVTLEQEATGYGETEEEGGADDPVVESDNCVRLARRDSGVAGLGLEGENSAAAGLEMELADADNSIFDCVNAGSDYSLSEQVNSESRMDSDGPVSKSSNRERMRLEPASSDSMGAQSKDKVKLNANQSVTTDLIVEQSEPEELVVSSSDDTALELELVHPEDVAARPAHLQEQALNPTDSTSPAPETAAAVDDDRLPSLESLLAGRTVPDPGVVSARLEHLVTEYCTAMADGGGAAAFRRLEDCGFAAALTTPLMRRVHEQLPQSGELVFVDSPGRCERLGCCIWLLVCASEVGALPLGLLLASSDSGGSLRAALELWQRTLPAGAFAGRGADGPQVVITDDGAGQRAALAAQFPAALTVLCAFRLLQSVWRWLWQVRGRVTAEDRSRLLLLARRLLRAGSVPQLERYFREAAGEPAMARHPDFLKQFTSIYRHRHLWAVWYGEEEPTDADAGSGSGAARTASLFDLASGLLRDRLLFMAAEYGPAEAFDFWTQRGDLYFLQRISRALSGGGSLASHPRYVPPPPGAELRVRRSGPHEHRVTDGSSAFLVDLELCCCTCRSGRAGAPCAHQSAAARMERTPPPEPVAAEVTARLRRLTTRLPLLEPDPSPLPAGWLRAITAAVGPPRVEVIVSDDQTPEANPRLSPTVEQNRLEDAEILFIGDNTTVQSEGGHVHNIDRTERMPSTTNSLGGDMGDIVGNADIVGLSSDLSSGMAGDEDAAVDPAEEAMSSAIVALQEVTADLTGRLAAEPERYVPLVRDLVGRYWRLGADDGLRAMADRLTELHTEMGTGLTDTGD